MQLRSKNRKRTIAIGTLGGVFLVIVVFLLHAPLGSLLQNTLATFSPTREGVYQTLPTQVLASRLKDAEDELAHIRYQALLYSVLSEEHERLIASLALPEDVLSGRGRVVARPPKTHYDTLLVALAPQSDPQEGDRAYAFGVLVGEVSKRTDQTALVSLYSAPGRTTEVRVGEPSAVVVMQGLGGGAFYVEVPKEIQTQVGDSIVSASDDDDMLAVVQRIVDEPERTQYRIFAASPVALSDMRVIEFKQNIPTP